MSGAQHSTRRGAANAAAAAEKPTSKRIGMVEPHSIEVEQAVLAAIMIDATNESYGIARQCGVRAKAFYSSANRRIWQVIEDLKARGDACTLLEVSAELQATNELADVGGPAYLAEITSGVVMSYQVRGLCEQLVLLRQRRHALELIADVSRATLAEYESREKFAEVLGEVGQKFIRFGRREAVRTLEEQIEAVRDDLVARAEGREDRRGWVPTGLPTFDARLKPLNSARLDGFTVIGGGSGHGKSALLRQLIWHVVETGGSAVVYTRETDIESLIEQMVATAVGVDLNNPQQALKETVTAFRETCDRLLAEVANKRLWVFQNEPATPLEKVEQLQAHYRAHAHLHGHPTVVGVDYLQIFGTEKRCGNREEVVATVSHTLQGMQRESGNLWLVLAQLNEAGLRDMRTLRRDDSGKVIHRIPMAGDIRESQAIFHDADRVIMLYRPPVDCRDQDNWGGNMLNPEIWLCQIKRRKGGEGYVRCWFNKRITKFTELDRGELMMAQHNTSTGGAVPPGGKSKAEWQDEVRKRKGGK